MNKKAKSLIISGIIISLVLIFSVTSYFVFAQESFDPEDTRLIGFEYLDSNGSIVSELEAEVIHIWNVRDNYFFNKSSGIQFTNHFQDYWTHNVFCGGYKNASNNWVYRCNDALPFNWGIKTDNETYVNYTGWRNIIVEGKEVRVAIRYHLKTNDKNITIQLSIKNIGSEPINTDLGFAWRSNNIQINGQEDDSIEVNSTSYLLNQTLDKTYTNLDNAIYKLSDKTGSDLWLKWNENLTYMLKVKSQIGQYNAPVTLGINIGTLAIGQEKHTEMFWHDADYWTYNITIFDVGDSLDPGDDTYVGSCEITVLEGNITANCGGANLVNLTIGETYFLRIKGNTSEADYNYDADATGETWMVSVNIGLDNGSNGFSQSNVATEKQYVIGKNVIPDDHYPGLQLNDGTTDIMFWSTVFDASITEAVADNINYSVDANIVEVQQVQNCNVIGDDLSERIVNYEGTESSSGDTDPDNGGFIGWDSQSMTSGEFYYWGIIFEVNQGWANGDRDTIGFHQGGEGGDSAQEINWNWTIYEAPVVEWNQSTLDLGESTSNITSVVEIRSNLNNNFNNTDVKIDCSGNCTQITTNWTTRNMTSSQNDTVLITCSNATEGEFQAIFNVTSDEDTSDNLFTVNCEIFTYGWLNVSISKPDDDSDWNQYDSNLTINATVTCSGGANARCGTVYALARYNLSSSPDTAVNTTEGGEPFYIIGEGAGVYEYSHNISLNSDNTGARDLTTNGTNIWVLDTDGHVYNYDNNGTYISNFSVVGEISSEHGISTNGSFIWAIGTRPVTFDQYIFKYYMNGTYTGESIDVDHLDSISATLESNGIFLYFIDNNIDRVYKYYNNGTYVSNFSVNQQTSYPEGISIGDGFIYISVDFSPFELFKYYMNGTYIENPINFSSNVEGFDIVREENTSLITVTDASDTMEFYTRGLGAENPKSQTLNQGESWNVTWVLNVTTSSIEDNYLIDVFFNSSYGNTNVTNNHTADRLVKLNPDIISPNITIDHPKPQTYSTNESLSLNYTVIDAGVGVDSCWFKVINSTSDLIIDNTTITNCLNITFNISQGTGTYNLTLYSNDTVSNLNSSTVEFGISVDNPAVVLDAPSDNSYLDNGTNIYFNFTATDSDGLSTCQFWGNWTGIWHKNYTWINPINATMNWTTQNRTEGTSIWNIWCNDSADNGGWAFNNFTLTVDETNPNVTITTANGTTVSDTLSITINYNISDINIDSCYFTLRTSGGLLHNYPENTSLSCSSNFRRRTR
jgi:hypothetical protein